jgi:hypothetical protein
MSAFFVTSEDKFQLASAKIMQIQFISYRGSDKLNASR